MTDPRLDFLSAHGAEVLGHSAHALLDHLRGTEALLAGWGARAALCDAGLFHSVYGTESYKGTLIPVTLRPAVQERIGVEAERLAHLFGIQEKESFYPNLGRTEGWWIRDRASGAAIELSEGDVRDLCALTVANWLEQRPRAPEHLQDLRRDSFRAMERWLEPPAWTALAEAYGF